MLLKVFLTKKAMLSSLNNENTLTLEITILRGDSKCIAKAISLHESGVLTGKNTGN